MLTRLPAAAMAERAPAAAPYRVEPVTAAAICQSLQMISPLIFDLHKIEVNLFHMSRIKAFVWVLRGLEVTELVRGQSNLDGSNHSATERVDF